MRGLVGAVLASVVWIAIASVTGLTYHLMPMSGGVAAALAVSWRGGAPPDREQFLAIGLGGLTSAVTAIVLAALSYSLDEWWVTLAALLAGMALGAGWLRLRSADQGDQIR